MPDLIWMLWALPVLAGTALAVRQQRRQAATEAALRAACAQAEARAQQLADELEDQADPIARVGADGRLLYANQAYLQLFGVQRAEVIGRSWHPTVPPEDLPAVEAALARMTPARPRTTVESRLRVAGGELRWFQWSNLARFDAQGRQLDFQGVGRDITDRKLLEQRLEEVATEFRQLYDDAPCGYHGLDERGRFLHINATELGWLGCSREQVVGRLSPTDFMTEASRATFAENFPRLRHEDRLHNLRLELVGQHGVRRQVLLNATLLRDAQGRFLVTRSVLLDVTALSEEQARRQAVEHTAAELRRLLDERSDMLGVLAHEVRQPLHNANAALHGVVRALVVQPDAAAIQHLTEAQRVMAEVLANVDNTLAVAALLAQAGPIDVADADIGLLLQLAVSDLAPEAAARVQVQWPADSHSFPMDMSLVRLALRNLLANALRYSPPGSPVTIQVAEQDEPPALLLDVVDTGPGLPPPLLPVLFERGRRGQGWPVTSGHGLGLYIVQRVMALHGGQVQLLRTGPDGTVIRLRIGLAALD